MKFMFDKADTNMTIAQRHRRNCFLSAPLMYSLPIDNRRNLSDVLTKENNDKLFDALRNPPMLVTPHIVFYNEDSMRCTSPSPRNTQHKFLHHPNVRIEKSRFEL